MAEEMTHEEQTETVVSVEEQAGEKTADEPASKRKRRVMLLAALGLCVLVAGGVLVGVLAMPTEQPDGSEGSAEKAAGADGSKVGAEDGKPTSGATGTTGNAGSPTRGTTAPDADTPVAGGEGASGDASVPATSAGNSGSSSSGGASTGGSGNGGGSGGGSGGGGGGSATPADPNAGKTWHEAWDEWVVDAPARTEQVLVEDAWDEETGHYGSRCNDCKVEITGNAYQHLLDTGHTGGYSTGFWFVDSTIHHEAVYSTTQVPEQGHWVHHDGYWR